MTFLPIKSSLAKGLLKDVLLELDVDEESGVVLGLLDGTHVDAGGLELGVPHGIAHVLDLGTARHRQGTEGVAQGVAAHSGSLERSRRQVLVHDGVERDAREALVATVVTVPNKQGSGEGTTGFQLGPYK